MGRHEGLVGGQQERRATRTATGNASVQVLEVLCECGQRRCSASVRVSVPTLAWGRSRGYSVLSSGHEAHDDSVAERTEEFVLVRPRHG